jgi:hypothetical protein
MEGAAVLSMQVLADLEEISINVQDTRSSVAMRLKGEAR